MDLPVIHRLLAPKSEDLPITLVKSVFHMIIAMPNTMMTRFHRLRAASANVKKLRGLSRGKREKRSLGLNMDMIRRPIKVEKLGLECSQFGKIGKYDSLIKQLLLLIFAAVHTTGYREKEIQKIKELVHSLTISTNFKILRILL